MGELRSKFLEVYSVLKAELLHDPAFEFTDDSRQWVERVNLHFSLSYVSHARKRTRCAFYFVYSLCVIADWVL